MEPKLVLPAIVAIVAILFFTFTVSGIPNIDPLVSLFGSFLGASVTIAAFVSVFISWVVERRINRGLDIFDEIQEKEWKKLTPQQSAIAFELMKQKYQIRYKSAEVPKDLRNAITLIYVPSLLVSMLSFAFIGYMLDLGKLGLFGFVVFGTTSALIIVSLLAFGTLLSDLMSLKKGWLFILPDPKQLDLSAFLKETLAMDFRVIIARIGFVRVRAALKELDEYNLFVDRAFDDLETDYEVIFETEKKTFSKTGSFKYHEQRRVVVRREDFSPIFQGTSPWRLRVELKGPFPSVFYEKDKKGNVLLSKPLFFKEVRYIFEERTRPKDVRIPIGFRVREVAYMKPEEKLEDFFLKETWIPVYLPQLRKKASAEHIE